jgi:hypothetical protein
MFGFVGNLAEVAVVVCTEVQEEENLAGAAYSCA